ncbi:hypothetical protein HZC34_03860 [Candidatus Saganbacteria bacterium]|nr:hypothetical protein [Candidatus Saganbacteria bacterium]
MGEEKFKEAFNQVVKQLKEAGLISGQLQSQDASWGAKSDKKFFAGYKVESNLDHKFGIITAIEADKAGHPEEKSTLLFLPRTKKADLFWITFTSSADMFQNIIIRNIIGNIINSSSLRRIYLCLGSLYFYV